MLNIKTGETVRFFANSASGTQGTAVPFTLTDASNNVRTLQSYERLIIDDLAGYADSTTGHVDVTDGADSSGDILGQFYTGIQMARSLPNEGIAVSVGSVPSVWPASSGGAFAVQGTGRIVSGKSAGTRANYKELLTPGGNVNGV